MQYSRKFFSLMFAGMLAMASASCSAEAEAPAATPVDSKLTEKNINDALKKAYDKYKGLKKAPMRITSRRWPRWTPISSVLCWLRWMARSTP